MSHKFLIGIDEAGRGPVAGPVSVAAFCVPMRLRKRLSRMFPGGLVRDSKKLTAAMREKVFRSIRSEKIRQGISYAVAFSTADVIDREGIVFAIKKALAEAIGTIGVPAKECLVLLDGSLKAPKEYVFQRTVIKGDEKEAVIALASVVAKVSRDKRMAALARKYPEYDFDRHKGYGTRLHYRKIEKHGLSKIHRRSFLKNVLK